MASEWRRAKLGQLMEFVSGSTPSKAAPQYWEGSIPWASAKDLKRFRLIDTQDHLTDAGAANGTKLVGTGTVLVLTRGMTLLNDVPVCVTGCPMTFNQDLKALRPKDGIRSSFLPYLILGLKPRLLGLVDLAGHGTGRLNTDELKAIEVSIPPDCEQERIARFLETLDDKIDSIQRMNDALKSLATAVFRSWFVDFDPVRAKVEGRDPFGMGTETAALFPNQFSDSAIGKIPLGWSADRWGTLAALEYGKSLQNYGKARGAFRVYGTNGPIGWHSKPLCPRPGIIIGRKGAYRGVHLSRTPFYVIDTAFYVAPKQELDIYWAYFEIQQTDLNAMDSGSAIPSTSREDFYAIPVVVPPLVVMKAFGETASLLYRKIDANLAESATLAGLRDALLPKLISGEIRLKDAEKELAAI